MLSEETNEKTINLAVRIGKLTGNEIRKALEKLIAELTAQKAGTQTGDIDPDITHGKQTLKQLSKQNDGLSAVELKRPNLRLLYQSMKKHNVDFAVVRDGKGKYTLFFKGKDVDSMTYAVKHYTQQLVKRNKGKSINASLAEAKQAAQTLNTGRDKEKNKSKGTLNR